MGARCCSLPLLPGVGATTCWWPSSFA